MTTNNQEYPERSECDFTPAYITPHVWEYTPVTPESQKRARELDEAMRLIREKLAKNMSSQDARVTLQAIMYREKLLWLIK